MPSLLKNKRKFVLMLFAVIGFVLNFRPYFMTYISIHSRAELVDWHSDKIIKKP